MSYDDFARTFAARAGTSLPIAVEDATREAIDEADLRPAITSRLAAGAFRLIIAVDVITPELRLIVEFLNDHTLPAVQVLALELDYARDGDVELLIPVTYGQEAAAAKGAPSTSGAKWNAASFAEEVRTRTEGSLRDLIEKLLEHGSQKGHLPFYGSGATPGMSYRYPVDGSPVPVWALYLNEASPEVAVNFGAISRRSNDKAVALLRRLRANPLLASALDERIDEATLGKKYPQIPIDPVLIDLAAQKTFFDAIDSLIDGGA